MKNDVGLRLGLFRSGKPFALPWVFLIIFISDTENNLKMRASLISVFFFTTLAWFPRAVVSVDAGDCSSSTTYLCPNCGGIQVSDCLECDGFLSTDNKHNICFDRRLFQARNDDTTDHEDHYHYLLHDLFGAVIWFITAGIAMACGVGGGGIYVPLGILLLQFAPKPASGLSQASIFGASLGGLLINARCKHPFQKIRHDASIPANEESKLGVQRQFSKNQEEEYIASGGKFYTRPLIDFDMALFLSPMAMAGAVLGVLVQKILPNWLYLLIAGLVLSFTSRKTYMKFFSAYEKEKKAREDTAKEEEVCSKTVHDSPLDSDSPHDIAQQELNPEDILTSAEEETEDSRLRKKYLEEDMRQYPTEKIAGLVILWIGLFLLTLMKGGKGVDSIVGITCESPVYAVLIVIQFAWMFGFSLCYGFKLRRDQAKRVAVKYPFFEADQVWDWSALKTFGFFSFLAVRSILGLSCSSLFANQYGRLTSFNFIQMDQGAVGGLIGIGGGMVLGPLMLVMGVDPRVSSAANATMVVLTSSSVAVMFVTSGQVHWTYAVFFFCICFIGAYLGKNTIDGYVKKTGRASFLIFILATIIAIATVGCLVIMVMRLAEQNWCFDGMQTFCTVSEGEDECIADRFLREIENILA